MKYKALVLIPFLLASCSTNTKKDNTISVMIEQGDNYNVFTPSIKIKRGSDALFQVSLKNNAVISNVSYSNYSIDYTESLANLTLKNVLYPTVVKLEVSIDYVTIDSNGGVIEDSDESTFNYTLYREHKRVNTPLGNNLSKDGYQLYGFKENKDDSESIPLGSRFSRATKTLYADYKKEVDKNSIGYKVLDNNKCTITSYTGLDSEVILPSSIDGYEVTQIDKNAFQNKNIDILFLPKTIKTVNDNSFINCNIKTISLFDNIKRIKDSSFNNCTIDKIRINANQKPCYMRTYYALFTDKVDLLIEKENTKKLVLFSGSTTRYGYNCSYLKEAYPSYNPINMGVFAYTNQAPQLEIIEHFLKDNDILLVSPEYDYNAFDVQFFTDNKLDSVFFRLIESDYQLFQYVNLKNYTNIFDAFSEYTNEKLMLSKNSYSESPQYYDDDQHYYSYKIYNEYMDFSLERYGDVESGRIYQPEIDYTTKRFTDEVFNTYNNFYKNYTTKNIKILFTYAPRNIDSLTVESTLENRQELEKLIQQKLNLTIISKLEDSFYPAYDFYLIDDHLTSEGAIIRTKKIIEDLKPYITD